MRTKGFTLIELLIVIGLLAILALGSFSVFHMVSEQGEADSAGALLQSMIVAAINSASSHGAPARLVFDQADSDGTTISVEQWTYNKDKDVWEWVGVPGFTDVRLGKRLFVFREIPNLPVVPTTHSLDEQNLKAWKDHQVASLEVLTAFVKAHKGSTYNFTLQFWATGAIEGSTGQVSVFTVVQIAGDGQALSYYQYVMNANSGARLVFE